MSDSLAKRAGSWVKIATGMFARRVFVGGSIYGTYPSNYYLEGTATEATAIVMYESAPVATYNRFTLGLTVLGATSVTVSASIDGTTFTNVRMFDASTGAVFATDAINALGTYYLDGKYKNVRVTITGTGTTTIIFNHGVM